jgi:hypothetical protein
MKRLTEQMVKGAAGRAAKTMLSEAPPAAYENETPAKAGAVPGEACGRTGGVS